MFQGQKPQGCLLSGELSKLGLILRMADHGKVNSTIMKGKTLSQNNRFSSSLMLYDYGD
jgi:hypothetical protein